MVNDFLVRLPRHDAGLSLHHNEHKTVYETVEQFLGNRFGEVDFVSPEERAKAIETNELWELHWYPNTPVGFYEICASSLEAIFEWLAANKDDFK